MKQNFFLIVLFFLFSFHAFAEIRIVTGRVRDKENPALPITGASIYWAGTTHGTTSGTEGLFSITTHDSSGKGMLVISFIGYRSDTLFVDGSGNELLVMLEKNIELGEIVVSERRKGIYLSSLDPVHTQKVTTTELQKAACCNLSESFETNASVDVAYSDAVTGAQQIKMLGLSGIYVQTLSENMPSVRGMAAPYGLGYVPGPWMESIRISKGTSSVVNGYEAIAGQINVEYKKPSGDEVFHFNLYGNDALRAEANLNYTYAFTDSFATTVLLHGEIQDREIDLNNDDFLDMPRVKQIHVMNRWNLIPKNGGHREIGFRILDELRQSGQIGAYGNLSDNLYRIEIGTRRYEVFAKNGILFHKPGTSLGIQLSGSYHEQRSVYGNTIYQGTQYNGYLNMIYMGNFGSDIHRFKTGTSIMGDWYRESLNDLPFDTDEIVPGVFFEYNYNLHDQLNLLAGLRADYSTQTGLFFTPRFHVKWNPLSWVTLRGSAGKGYRRPVPLAENLFLLASSRELVIDENLRQEEAVNLGTGISIDIPLDKRSLTFIIDYYYTNFLNQVVRDLDSDVHRVHFMNLEGVSYSGALQAELLFELFKGFTLNAAWRWMDVKQTLSGVLREAPLSGRYKGMASFSYATRMNKWQFDLTGQFNGGGRMPDPDFNQPLWKTQYEPYTVVNAQITKRYRQWDFYAGVENLFDYTMDNPVIDANDPWGPDFDGTMVWGPIHGRKIYFGLRYTLNGFK